MHNLEVVLAITSPNFNTPGDTFVLMQDVPGQGLSLPRRTILTNENSFDVAALMLKTETGLETNWINLTQCFLADAVNRQINDERWIAIPYGCIVPKDAVKVKNGKLQWVTATYLLNRASSVWLDHMDIFMRVCRQI